jgi:hypothetical protein
MKWNKVYGRKCYNFRIIWLLWYAWCGLNTAGMRRYALPKKEIQLKISVGTHFLEKKFLFMSTLFLIGFLDRTASVAGRGYRLWAPPGMYPENVEFGVVFTHTSSR